MRFAITFYDLATRRLMLGLQRPSHMSTIQDHVAATPGLGYLVGDFTALIDTHRVAADADDSPFAKMPDDAALFVVPIEPSE